MLIRESLSKDGGKRIGTGLFYYKEVVMSNVLSAEEIASFERNGYIHVKEAFPAEDALTMQDFMWDQLNDLHGIVRENRSTWDRHTSWMSRTGDDPVYRPTGSPRMCGAIDQLLGPDNWQMPKKWGGFLITFPISTTGSTQGIGQWHWDCNPVDHLDGRAGLFIFTIYSDIGPRAGGTLIVSGSHRLILHFFERQSLEERQRKHKAQKKAFARTHPWLEALNAEVCRTRDDIQRFMDEPAEVDSVRIQVVEITGKPGDAYICHPAIYHATSMNMADMPRFMRVKGLG